MSELEKIRAYARVEENLGTSGMPRPEDFATIRKAGFEVVVNLALPTSDNAMANEGDLVAREGMAYVHSPVKFDAPAKGDFTMFSTLMDGLAGKQVHVHCAANWRVSAFVFLHRVLRGKAARVDAERDMRRIWNPDPVWLGFINDRLKEAGQPALAPR
jgi:protein tyrosine phosphatase (PTP) superfamily phosphohydrolase (DUF442 family)